jgi:hypothetical protein
MTDAETQKVTILLKMGVAKQAKLEFDVYFPKVHTGNGVVLVTSGGDSRPVACVPVDILESVVIEDYRTGS